VLLKHDGVTDRPPRTESKASGQLEATRRKCPLTLTVQRASFFWPRSTPGGGRRASKRRRACVARELHWRLHLLQARRSAVRLHLCLMHPIKKLKRTFGPAHFGPDCQRPGQSAKRYVDIEDDGDSKFPTGTLWRKKVGSIKIIAEEKNFVYHVLCCDIAEAALPSFCGTCPKVFVSPRLFL